MDAPFPFGLPPATAFYAVLYLVTLVLHVVFMNYVLGGTVVLAIGLVRRWLRASPRPASPVLTILKDWLPFALSAAITAGIGPLLFVQILYQREFYTANLLLFHRWMAILPVLIAAFYLLYLLKARRLETHPAVKSLIALLTTACILFVAYAWTENHLLSLNRAAWPAHFASGAMVYHDPLILPRLLVWFFGALPTLTLLLGWQLRAGASGTDSSRWTDAARELGWVAFVGLGLTAAAAGWVGLVGGDAYRRAATGAVALPWFLAAVIGALLQAGAWGVVAAGRRLSLGPLRLATAGLALTLVGGTVVREAVRLERVELAALVPNHAAAARTGGIVVFLVFAALALLAIVRIIRAVSRALEERRS